MNLPTSASNHQTTDLRVLKSLIADKFHRLLHKYIYVLIPRGGSDLILFHAGSHSTAQSPAPASASTSTEKFESLVLTDKRTFFSARRHEAKFRGQAFEHGMLSKRRLPPLPALFVTDCQGRFAWSGGPGYWGGGVEG